MAPPADAAVFAARHNLITLNIATHLRDAAHSELASSTEPVPGAHSDTAWTLIEEEVTHRERSDRMKSRTPVETTADPKSDEIPGCLGLLSGVECVPKM